MFAPSTMPIACESFIMPEFTKPTTIADVAEEDWITGGDGGRRAVRP